MPRAETVRVAIFVTFVGGVYAAALHQGIAALRRRRAGRAARVARWLVLTLAAIGLLCMAYGFRDSWDRHHRRWMGSTLPVLRSAGAHDPRGHTARPIAPSSSHC